MALDGLIDSTQLRRRFWVRVRSLAIFGALMNLYFLYALAQVFINGPTLVALGLWALEEIAFIAVVVGMLILKYRRER